MDKATEFYSLGSTASTYGAALDLVRQNPIVFFFFFFEWNLDWRFRSSSYFTLNFVIFFSGKSKFPLANLCKSWLCSYWEKFPSVLAEAGKPHLEWSLWPTSVCSESTCWRHCFRKDKICDTIPFLCQHQPLFMFCLSVREFYIPVVKDIPD